MNIIVAGSRSFKDFNLMVEKLDKILSNIKSEITIISGGAQGADLMGEAYATYRGHKCLTMPAEWDKYGRSAGYKRNEAMAEIATHCVVFWDGKSPGSRHMINIATRKGLKTRTVRY